MGLTLSHQVEDLFENGLLNILQVIPPIISDRERLSIESVVYPAYGFYRTYRRVESMLITSTDNEGIPKDDPGFSRDVFTDVWSLVDCAYSLSKTAILPDQRKFLKFSDETSAHMSAIAELRNYMDHPSENFANTVAAKGWLPLFGWVTYQFTPCARNIISPKNKIHLIILSSTHLRGETTISAPDHTTASVLSEIDHIRLHIKRKQFCDLSRLLVTLALDLNTYSMGIQTYLIRLLEQPQPRSRPGLTRPFPWITVNGDLGTQSVELQEIKSLLDENKIRMKASDTK